MSVGGFRIPEPIATITSKPLLVLPPSLTNSFYTCVPLHLKMTSEAASNLLKYINMNKYEYDSNHRIPQRDIFSLGKKKEKNFVFSVWPADWLGILTSSSSVM